jgi:hypothetical protein
MVSREVSPASATPALRPFRFLSWTLAAGAAYDLFFALLMLAAPGLLERQFALPLPGERFYLRLLAVAIAGRAVGAIVLALDAARPDLGGLWMVAAGDAAWSLLHLAASRGLWR